jgi:hypothetical protein
MARKESIMNVKLDVACALVSASSAPIREQSIITDPEAINLKMR